MTNISDLLSSDNLKALAKQSIKVGNVYRIKMTEANGIKPKAGDASRNKFFVVLGFDNESNVYGGVIINSAVNKNIAPAIKYLQMPIKCGRYGFLSHDSFVDCSKLKVAHIEKFKSWKFLGEMLEEDVGLIIGTIKESPVETAVRLSKFGL